MNETPHAPSMWKIPEGKLVLSRVDKQAWLEFRYGEVYLRLMLTRGDIEEFANLCEGLLREGDLE